VFHSRYYQATVFWVFTPCSRVGWCYWFRGTCRFRLPTRKLLSCRKRSNFCRAVGL